MGGKDSLVIMRTNGRNGPAWYKRSVRSKTDDEEGGTLIRSRRTTCNKCQRRTTTRQRRTTEQSADNAVQSTYVCLGATSRRRRVGVKFLERMWAFSVGEGCARRRWTVGQSTCATVVTCWRGHNDGALQHVSCQTTVGHQPAVVIFVTWSRCRRMVNRTLSEFVESLETSVWRTLTHTIRSKLSANV